MNSVPRLIIMPGDLEYITPGSFLCGRPLPLLVNPKYPALTPSLILPIIIKVIMLPKPGSKSQPISCAQSSIKSTIKGIKGKDPINLSARFQSLESYLITTPPISEPLLSPGRYKGEKQPGTNLIKGDPENFYQAQYKTDSLGLAGLNTLDNKANDNLDHINFGDLLTTQVAL